MGLIPDKFKATKEGVDARPSASDKFAGVHVPHRVNDILHVHDLLHYRHRGIIRAGETSIEFETQPMQTVNIKSVWAVAVDVANNPVGCKQRITTRGMKVTIEAHDYDVVVNLRYSTNCLGAR